MRNAFVLTRYCTRTHARTSTYRLRSRHEVCGRFIPLFGAAVRASYRPVESIVFPNRCSEGNRGCSPSAGCALCPWCVSLPKHRSNYSTTAAEWRSPSFETRLHFLTLYYTQRRRWILPRTLPCVQVCDILKIEQHVRLTFDVECFGAPPFFCCFYDVQNPTLSVVWRFFNCVIARRFFESFRRGPSLKLWLFISVQVCAIKQHFYHSAVYLLANTHRLSGANRPPPLETQIW